MQEGTWPCADHLGRQILGAHTLFFRSAKGWGFVGLIYYKQGAAEAKLAGTLLANGMKAVCWSLVGDMEYLVQRLGFPHYSLKAGLCGLCKCKGDDGSDSWKDCGELAQLGMEAR